MPNYTHGSCKVSSRRSFCSSVKNNFKKWLLHHFGGQPSWVKAVIPLLLFGVAVKTYVHTQGNVYVYKSVRSDFKATVSTFLYVSNNTASTIKIGVIEYASVARKWMVRTLALILNMQCVPQNTSTNLLIHRSSSVKKKKSHNKWNILIQKKRQKYERHCHWPSILWYQKSCYIVMLSWGWKSTMTHTIDESKRKKQNKSSNLPKKGRK